MLNKLKETFMLLTARLKEFMLSTALMHGAIGAALTLTNSNLGGILIIVALGAIAYKTIKNLDKD